MVNRKAWFEGIHWFCNIVYLVLVLGIVQIPQNGWKVLFSRVDGIEQQKGAAISIN